jgi:phage baseplate assembly protein W
MATDYGTDLLCSFGPGGEVDLDPHFALVSGARNVALAVARRLVTDAGTLVGHEDYGANVLALLRARATPQVLSALRQAVQAQAEADERVQSARVTVETKASGAAQVLARVVVQLTLAQGQTFRLVLAPADAPGALKVLALDG